MPEFVFRASIYWVPVITAVDNNRVVNYFNNSNFFVAEYLPAFSE